MLYTAKIAVCTEIHTKQKAVSAPHENFWTDKPGGT